MQKGLNKVQLIGYLGQNPDVKYTSSGTCVTTLSLATGESWRDKQTNQMQETTEWHRVVIFGKLAEVAGEYLKKGTLVYIEGQLRTRKWLDEQIGQNRYTTEIVVGVRGIMQMLGGNNQKANQASDSNPQASKDNLTASKWMPAEPAYSDPNDYYGADDDIPF